jgi:6-methylsalicylate decarboxylase
MPVAIDVHHHILPDFFWRQTNDGAHPVGGLAPSAWDEASALAFMDDAGIDVAITSITTSGVHVGDDARASARTSLQRTFCRHDRLVAEPVWRLHCVTAPRCDGALAELAYADDVLKLDGVVLFSNANGAMIAKRPAK